MSAKSRHASLFPTTNQEANALRSSALNLLHPRMVNHLSRIRKRCHQLSAAARRSSLVGRWPDESAEERFIRRRMNGLYSWIFPTGRCAGTFEWEVSHFAHLPASAASLLGMEALPRRGKCRGSVNLGGGVVAASPWRVKNACTVRYRSACAVALRGTLAMTCREELALSGGRVTERAKTCLAACIAEQARPALRGACAVLAVGLNRSVKQDLMQL